MVSLKRDRFLQFTISSGNKFQSLMVAGKKECLKVSVVQMGSLSDFELLIRVFLVLIIIINYSIGHKNKNVQIKVNDWL